MMERITKHIYLTMCVLALSLFVSCDKIIDRSHPLCDYTVQLRYHYNQENTATENQYSRYIKSADEYIFDAEGVLYAMGSVAADPRTGAWVSELDLPPGRYSVIAVGNRTAMSRVHDNGNAPQIGLTQRDDMTLTLENEVRSRAERGYFDNTDRLYYGYRTFTISPNDISHIRVDMVHVHCVINYTIRWVAPARPPADANNYFLQISDLPSQYNLMPEFVYARPNGQCEPHNPSNLEHDPYNSVCQNVRHYIPTVQKPGMLPAESCNMVTHRMYVPLIGRLIMGQSVTYRLRNEGAVQLSLHATRAGEEIQLMKNIPINEFLNDMGIDLDSELKQEYNLIFEIQEDGRVWVAFAEVEDWDEGGWISK